MRLDEAGDDADLGLHEITIEQSGRAGPSSSKLEQCCRILWLMIHDPVIPDHGRCEHLFQFRTSIGPVRAELID